MLLDEMLPTYHFNEVHDTIVRVAPDDIFRAIRETPVAEIPWFRTLFWIRSAPGLLSGRRREYFTNDGTPILEQALNKLGFVVLAEQPGRELVFGAIGKWWRPWGAEFYQMANVQDFLEFNRPGYASVAANFRVDVRKGMPSPKLSTETRIYAPDPAARKKFAAYWRIVYPGSALLRIMWLAAIKRRAERA